MELFEDIKQRYNEAPWWGKILWVLPLILLGAIALLAAFGSKGNRPDLKRNELDNEANEVIVDNTITEREIAEDLKRKEEEERLLAEKEKILDSEEAKTEATIEEIRSASSFEELRKIQERME